MRARSFHAVGVKILEWSCPPVRAKVDRWARRADVVLVPRMIRRTVRGDVIPCAGVLQQRSGTMDKFMLDGTVQC